MKKKLSFSVLNFWVINGKNKKNGFLGQNKDLCKSNYEKWDEMLW